MRMIGCVSPVTEGTLRVLGLDPATDGRAIRARLGVVPQQDTLDMELTVRENLVIYGRYFDLSRREAGRRADELLEFVQLTDRASSQVEPLSGGMKRRLTIARSLINEPEPAAARRAHHRSRPAGPPPPVGPAVPAQAARRDPRPDHALHGRGRAAVRPPGGHGQGPDRGRGLAPRAHRAVLDPRGARVALRRPMPSQPATPPRGTGRAAIEGLPDRMLLYTDDGEAAVVAVHERRDRARDGPRAAVHARGRLPPADRPDAWWSGRGR